MTRRSIRRVPILFRSLAVLALVALAAVGLVAGPRLVGAQSSGFAAGDSLVVNTDALNLRADASISADVIAVLATGESVTIVDGPVSADGYDWYSVSTAEGDGYVDGEFLATTVTVSTGTWATGDALAVNTDVLNLRAEPSTSADVLAQLVTGDAVTVVDGPVSADSYSWYQVQTIDGTTGWVAGEYLGTTVTYASAATSSLGFAVGDNLVVDADSLNLRADATTSADVLAQLSAGDSVAIADGPVSADGYTWYEVSTDAGTGWVAGEYLGTTVTVSSSTGFAVGSDVVVTADVLNVRADATTSADVATQLIAGDGATILDGPVGADGYIWYRVEIAGGTTGWVASDYLSLA